MLSNYLKIAWRNLLKYKLYSGINVLGLTLGIASFLVVLLFLKNEFSYDKFNTNIDRIYRLDQDEITSMAQEYAKKMKSFPFRSVEELRSLFREFDTHIDVPETTLIEIGPKKYARLVATKR